ncbi:DNA pilot protein VP2 [Microviridae Fen7940_21]|uniref:DNA pilot protein VP2 n=1 Tax=Microviridae Fen7940_21 TaxID=1655662 RepID=UPI00063D6316|nr:DNA pilot protein VP2 [Microviridae Fen7940_21]AKI26955.1 DNA pilot protein VP2 [Microviridae Fen7940_21]
MGSLLGGLVSGGLNLIGGLYGQASQTRANTANLENSASAEANSLSWLRNNATQAGINPLAALGISTVEPATQVGSNALGESLTSAGSDISRAANAMSSSDDKSTQLDNALTQAKIDNMNADTARMQAVNSTVNRALGSTGSPPSVPLPVADPRYTEDVKPAAQRFSMPDGSVVVRPSAAFTQSNFSINPTGPYDASRIDTYSQQADPTFVRPDISRSVSNLGLQNIAPAFTNSGGAYDPGMSP